MRVAKNSLKLLKLIRKFADQYACTQCYSGVSHPSRHADRLKAYKRIKQQTGNFAASSLYYTKKRTFRKQFNFN